jgi:hypothetical protein
VQKIILGKIMFIAIICTHFFSISMYKEPLILKRTHTSHQVILPLSMLSEQNHTVSTELPLPIFDARIQGIQEWLHKEKRTKTIENPTEAFIESVYTKHGWTTFKIMQLIAKFFNKDSCIHYHTANKCFEIINSNTISPSQLQHAFNRFFYKKYEPRIKLTGSLEDNIYVALAPVHKKILLISGSETVPVITDKNLEKTVREIIYSRCT